MGRHKMEYIVGSKINDMIYIGNEKEIILSSGKIYREADFICKCGNLFRGTVNNVKRKHTNSCGCYNKEMIIKANTTHGQCRNFISTPEYAAWLSMKERCYNPKTHGFKNWGGRGIKVCNRWMESFENFFEDMGVRPSSKHSLDRFPNNETGDYELGNCRWATKKEQANNRRSFIRNAIEYDNRKNSLRAWCREVGVNYQNAVYRLRTGWPLEKVFTTPNGKYIKKIYRKKFIKNGIELGIKEWANKFNVKYGTFKKYLYNHSFDEAYDRYSNRIRA